MRSQQQFKSPSDLDSTGGIAIDTRRVLAGDHPTSLPAAINSVTRTFRSPERRAAALIAIVAAAIYIPTLWNGWVSDDWHMIVDNEWIRDPTSVGRIFTQEAWAFAGQEPSSYFRPLMHVAYLALFWLFGPAPAAFHAANIVAHVAATLAVFGLVRRFVPDERGAVFGAMLFALHPVHVEAVAWVAALPDIACAGLAAGSLLMFLSRPDGRIDATHAVGAGMFLAAVLFKEAAVLLPGIILALDIAERRRGSARFWVSRYGSLATAALAYAVLRLNALGAVAVSAERPSAVAVLALAGSVAWHYVAVLAAPIDLNVARTASPLPLVGAMLALLAFPALIVLAAFRRSVAWTAACGVFFLTLLPALLASGLLRWDNPWAERYAYLPSVGFCIGAAAAFAMLRDRVRNTTVVALALLVVMAGAAVGRTQVWRDDLTLWADAVQKSPQNGAARLNLGSALLVRGNVDGAISELQTATGMRPGDADAHLNLGVALATKGLHAPAVAEYEAALRARPNEALAHADLAISLSMLGDHGRARDEARQAIALRPRLEKAHFALGLALGNAGDAAGAAAAFRTAFGLDPTDDLNRANLARAESMLQGVH